MLTTRSRSSNSKRCGVSASRSAGPISGSSLIIAKIWSITSRNSSVGLELRRGHQEEGGLLGGASSAACAARARLGGGRARLGRGRAAWRPPSAWRRSSEPVPAAFAVDDAAGFLAVVAAARAAAARGGGLRRAGAGFVLERGDAAGQRLDLGAQALEVLEHVDVLDHLAHAAGGAGDLVDEVLGARARRLSAVGGRLERALDGGADGADRVGRLVVLLGLLLVLFRHGARKSSSMPTAMASAPVHLRPNAPVAERALLPGDPGRALRLAQHLLEAPMQVLNTNRGLWGYTGTAADGAPLTIQSTGMGGPSARDRRRGADRARGAAARAGRDLRRARRRPAARRPARRRRGAVRGRREPRARRRRARRRRPGAAAPRWRARPATPVPSSPPTSSTTPTPARRALGRRRRGRGRDGGGGAVHGRAPARRRGRLRAAGLRRARRRRRRIGDEALARGELALGDAGLARAR